MHVRKTKQSSWLFTNPHRRSSTCLIGSYCFATARRLILVTLKKSSTFSNTLASPSSRTIIRPILSVREIRNIFVVHRQIYISISFAYNIIVEQVKGTAETQERIITSYRETRSDPDLAEQLLMTVGVGGTTSTSTIYENYLDGLHGSNLDPGEYKNKYFCIQEGLFNWCNYLRYCPSTTF